MSNVKKSFSFLLTVMVCGLFLFNHVPLGAAQDGLIVVISSDTTWTKAGSPYNITGPFLISEGATLTIEAGVTVDFNYHTLRVNGNLRALGTSAEKILFVDCMNIEFTEASVGWDEQTGSGNILQYTNKNSTSVSISIDSSVPLKLDHVIFSTIEVANSSILSNSKLGIVTAGSSCVISNNTLGAVTVGSSSVVFGNNISRDVTALQAVVSYNYIGGKVDADNSTISNNQIRYGITGSSLIITNNNVTVPYSSGQLPRDAAVYVGSGTSIISNNHVVGSLIVEDSDVSTNNVEGYISAGGSTVAYNNTVSGTFLAGGSAVVSNNTILDGVRIGDSDWVKVLNNTIYGGVDISPFGRANASIVNNTIVGGEFGVYIIPTSNVGLVISRASEAYISGNLIYDCTAAGIQVGGVGETQGGSTVLYNYAVIDGNTVINCNYGIEVTGRENVTNNIVAHNEYGIKGGKLVEGNTIVDNYYGLHGGSEIRNNAIINNTIGVRSGFEILVYNNIYGNSEYNVEFLSIVNANASYNWWGTTDTQAINQTIYDFKNDFTLGKVNFVPFLTEPNSGAIPASIPVVPEY